MLILASALNKSKLTSFCRLNKKKKNSSNKSKPSKSKSSGTSESILHYCELQGVHELPYDLNGTCVYLFTKRLAVAVASHVVMKAAIFENAMVKTTSLSLTNPKILAAFVEILVSLFLAQLEAVKNWEFDDSAGKMTVRNDDGARKRDKEAICKFRRSKKLTAGVTVTRSTEDNCLKEDELCLDNIYNIAVSTLEKDKLYYAKRKAHTAQSDPHKRA